MLPKVVAVIISNSRQADTLACLASLKQSTYPNLSVLVLDNQSKDGTVPAIRAEFPEVIVIELSENKGYAGNNNLGLKMALDQQADWVFVLNDDTTLAPDCIDQLVKIGLSNAHIGLVGPLIYHANEVSVIQSAGGTIDRHWVAQHRGRNQTDTGQFSDPAPVDWLSGCALLMRRQVVEALTGFDERFFMYCEEVDWCLRATQQGWLQQLAPQAKLWHKGALRNYQPAPSVTYYMTRNQLLLLRKHHAPLAVQAYQWAQTVRTLVSWTVKPQWRAKRDHRDALWQGLVDFTQQRWGPRPT